MNMYHLQAQQCCNHISHIYYLSSMLHNIVIERYMKYIHYQPLNLLFYTPSNFNFNHIQHMKTMNILNIYLSLICSQYYRQSKSLTCHYQVTNIINIYLHCHNYMQSITLRMSNNIQDHSINNTMSQNYIKHNFYPYNHYKQHFQVLIFLNIIYLFIKLCLLLK